MSVFSVRRIRVKPSTPWRSSRRKPNSSRCEKACISDPASTSSAGSGRPRSRCFAGQSSPSCRLTEASAQQPTSRQVCERALCSIRDCKRSQSTGSLMFTSPACLKQRAFETGPSQCEGYPPPLTSTGRRWGAAPRSSHCQDSAPSPLVPVAEDRHISPPIAASQPEWWPDNPQREQAAWRTRVGAVAPALSPLDPSAGNRPSGLSTCARMATFG
jgi:hypothetical protein